MATATQNKQEAVERIHNASCEDRARHRVLKICVCVCVNMGECVCVCV